jgi:uncharacterized protein GlcG (DUF336 family)
MDLLAFAKNIADSVEAQSTRAQVPVAVCVIDIHGNVVLKHRMSGAPAFSTELSERKAYTSALVGLRTADLFSLVQPGQHACLGRDFDEWVEAAFASDATEANARSRRCRAEA